MVLNVEAGFANGGPLVRTFPATGNALLSGFYFQYVNEDHNLSRRLDRQVFQVMAFNPVPDGASRNSTCETEGPVHPHGACIRPRPARDAVNKGGP
jgi:hypothetical protein